MGRQSRSCRKPAEYRGFAYTTITSSSHHDRQRHPRHGPNRSTPAENQSSPYRHRPPHTQRPRPSRKPQTAKLQRSPNTTITSRRHTGHTTARNRGPNPKSQAETGTSPYNNLTAPGPPIIVLPQNRRIPGICLLSYNLPPPNQLPGPPELRTESENARRKPIQSTRTPAATQPATPASPQNRKTPTVPRHHKDQPPAHQPCNHPKPRTEPEITGRNRTQSTTALADTRPPTTTPPQNREIPRVPRHHDNQPQPTRPQRHLNLRTEPEITRRNRNQSPPALANTQTPTTTPLQNRGIPTVRSFHHNPPPPGQIPEMPAPRTESENEPEKPIRSHNGTRSPGPPTMTTLEIHKASTIRQHTEHQPPALRYPDSPYFRNY